jgi:hypothetical protein
MWHLAQEAMRTFETSDGREAGGTFACSCVVCADKGFEISARNKMAHVIAAVNLIKFFIVKELKDWKILNLKVQKKFPKSTLKTQHSELKTQNSKLKTQNSERASLHRGPFSSLFTMGQNFPNFSPTVALKLFNKSSEVLTN